MKVITATLAGFALAAGLAAPTSTRADESDIAKIIAGIATVAVIAELADRSKKRKDAKAALSLPKAPSRHVGTWAPDRRADNRPTYGRLIEQHRRAGRANPLPARCERLIETRRGERLVYGARCLERRYTDANRLPRDCAVLIDTERGQRVAYTARCLRRDGWRVARR